MVDSAGRFNFCWGRLISQRLLFLHKVYADFPKPALKFLMIRYNPLFFYFSEICQ